MGIGLIAAAGAGAGLGAGAAEVGKEWLKDTFDKERQAAIAARELNLANLRINAEKELQAGRFGQETKMVDVREQSRRSGAQADIEREVAPANVAARAKAASDLSTATLPADLARRTAIAGVETQAELDKFSKLAPLKRTEAIATAVESLRAMSTPEMLRAERNIAQAKHIVDPSYSLVPNADGTVTTFDARSGKTGGVLKGPDGEPIIRKDPEELKAASGVINMANTNLKIAQAAFKAAESDINLTPAEKGAAIEQWKQAQAEAQRMTAPAYAVLYSKAGIPKGAPAEAAPAAGRAQWDDKTGDVLIDGKKVGSAKTQDEAIKLARSARQAPAGGETARGSQSGEATVAKREPAPAYTAPAGTMAAAAAERQRGLIEKRLTSETASAEGAARVRDDFEVDRRHLSAKALVAKYGNNVDSLTDQQKALIFKARNEP